MKYARMPDEPLNTEPTPPSSVQSGVMRGQGDEGSGLSSSEDEDYDNESEEEREKKLRELQEQVYLQKTCILDQWNSRKFFLF